MAKILIFTVTAFFTCFISAAESTPAWKELFPGVKTIAVIAPGSPGKSRDVDAAVDRLRHAGYTVKVMPHARENENTNKLVSAAKRAADLTRAWLDPETDIIICVRGGRGSHHLVPLLDWEKLRTRNMRVIGFSDITNLHCAMAKFSAGTPMSGPSLTSLLRCDTASLQWFSRTIARREHKNFKLQVIKPGSCQSQAIVGHIWLFVNAVQKGIVPDTSGKLIIMETPVGSSVEIEKRLNYLLEKQFFDRCSGIVFGHLNRLSPQQAEKMITAFSAKVNCPVYMGLPYGHKPANYLFDYSSMISISADGVMQVMFPEKK